MTLPHKPSASLRPSNALQHRCDALPAAYALRRQRMAREVVALLGPGTGAAQDWQGLRAKPTL